MDEGNAFAFYGGSAGIAATPSLTIDSAANQTFAHFASCVGP